MNPFAVADMNSEDFLLPGRGSQQAPPGNGETAPPRSHVRYALDQELTTFFEDNRRIANDPDSDQKATRLPRLRNARLRDSESERAPRDCADAQPLHARLNAPSCWPAEGEDLLANELPITTFSLTSASTQI